MLLHVVFRLYAKTKKVPPFVLVLMSASSYRIHSIFVLRMFNDGVAMLILYLALALFTSKRWTLGCFMYRCVTLTTIVLSIIMITIITVIDSNSTTHLCHFSVAVSVKMNILLFAPALFFILLSTNGYVKTALNLGVCAFVQLVTALPFLVGNYKSYIIRSFDFGK